MHDTTAFDYLGYGIGLRPEYYEDILSQQGKPPVDFLELISENYMVDGGKPKYYLQQIAERLPLVMHGVSLSAGGTDPLDMDYLRRLKKLACEIKPRWISDHLCWCSHGGHNLHDLMPLPYHEESVKHVAARIRQVQDFLERRILLENVSSYVSYRESDLSEWAYYNAVIEEADCLMLVDINNIYVSARNHGFDPVQYIDALPMHRVKQIHLAGHSDYGDYVIDTHDHPVCDRVWSLYRHAVDRFGPVTTLLERDDRFPPYEELISELNRARKTAESAGEKVA